MNDESDRHNNQDDNNESLVMALESIKTLLATGDKKIAKVRETLKQTTATLTEAKIEESKTDEPEEPEIPVLQDVIIPGKPMQEKVVPVAPASEETPLAEKPVLKETLVPPKPVLDAEALYQFQTRLENEMHDKLLNYVIELEDEMKARIEDFIKQQLEK